MCRNGKVNVEVPTSVPSLSVRLAEDWSESGYDFVTTHRLFPPSTDVLIMEPVMTRFCRALIAAVLIPLPALAAAGEAILTFRVGDDVHEYDREALAAMPAVTFRTTTIWTEGDQTFTGVPLAYFLAEVDVAEGMIEARAINDYAVQIPVSDAVEDGPIIAYRRNGEDMSVRDKGPLWIVYPFDSNQEYQSEVIYSRSIWQLDRLSVLP